MVIAAVSALVYLQALRLPPYLESDQKMVGAVVMSKIKPENFANDYALTNPDFFGSYYPFYVNTLIWLTERTGSFVDTLAVLITAASFLYMTGMALLFFRFTGSRWVSVVFAIITASRGLIGPIRDVWGPFLDIWGMRPGNLYLSVATFLFLLLLGVLASRGNRRKTSIVFWGLLGLAFGLLTNIHQVSALGVVTIVSVLILLAVIRREVRFEFLAAFVVSILVGAIPAILPYLQHAESVSPDLLDFSFTAYYGIAKDLANMVYPTRLWYIAGWLKTFRLGKTLPENMFCQSAIIITYSLLTAGSALGSWWASRKGNLRALHATHIALVTVQLVMAAVFTIIPHWISLLMVVYLVNRIVVENQPDRADKRLVEAMVVVLGFFPLSYVLQWVWRTFEVWQLSTWATQLTRELRFIYLPVFILIARLLALWLRRKDYAMLAMAATLFIWEDQVKTSLAVLLFAWVIMLIWSLKPQPEARARWYKELLNLLVIVFIGQFLIGQTILLAVIGAALYYSWRILRKYQGRLPFLQHEWQYQGVLSGMIIILLLVVFYDLGITLRSKSLWVAVLLVGTWPMFIYLKNKSSTISKRSVVIQRGFILLAVILGLNIFGRMLYHGLDTSAHSLMVWVHSIQERDNKPYLLSDQITVHELYDWARTDTPEDSVFYYDNPAFRLFAERSITHSSKDFGQAFFARYLLIDFYERYNRLESAFNEKDKLLDAVEYTDADYIVATREKQELMKDYIGQFDWQLVFENSNFAVYQIEN